MSRTIQGDDGLLADVVQSWTKHKHGRLRHYLSISSAARNKFITSPAHSSAFIDLFCGAGRAWVEETEEWIDGSAVAAWKISKESGAPFTDVYVADKEEEKRRATVERLQRLGAPVREFQGSAVEAAGAVSETVSKYGLHFAFIDPYGLAPLNFQVIQSLAKIRRMDMLIHISKMDHQRNLRINLQNDASALDSFAPGWREKIDQNQTEKNIRVQVINYWKELVAETGKTASENWDLVKGSQGQHLYWLLLVAEHELAQRFWNETTKERQGNLFS